MATHVFVRIAVAVVLGLAALAAHAQQGGCRCSDARDLFTRYCAAQAAVGEWNRLINRVRDQEREKKAVIPLSDLAEEFDDCVDSVISMHREEGPGSRRVRGITDADCNVTIEAPNACMRGVIEHHESWHRMVCEAQHRPDAPWRASAGPFTYLAVQIWGWRSQQSAIDYMYEERTGYMLEIDYTRDRLEELAARCEEPQVFRPAQQGRSFTPRSCPQPNLRQYTLKCKIK
jgi:hypothetical protein